MEINNEQEVQNKQNGKWLVFKIKNQYFAVKCLDVENIFKVDVEAKNMSGYSNYVRGVIDFRGQVMPLLEMRNVLGIESFDDEASQFTFMIQDKIQLQQSFIDELEMNLLAGENIGLLMDSSETEFGKWLQSYEANNQIIQSNIKKIQEPYREIFKCIEKINDISKNIDTSDDIKAEQKIQIINEVKENYNKRIISMLHEITQLYVQNFREMCIVLSGKEKNSIGILVDEVVSVTELDIIDSRHLFDSPMSQSCVTEVASLKDDKNEIFILDLEKLHEKIY